MASRHGSSRRSMPMRDEDFEEDDVWSSVKEREDSRTQVRRSKDSFSTPRTIPRRSKIKPPASQQQSSAPMSVPDWSKIYGKTVNGYDDDGGGGGVDDDDDDVEMVPPHEWLARKLARSQISSFSMCEGVGRTLKGRDLSKVRNAVLTITGFLE